MNLGEGQRRTCEFDLDEGTENRGHSDGRTVTIRRAARSNSGNRKFSVVATIIERLEDF